MPRRDERVDEGLVHTWLDGELDAVEAARVERLVAEDAEWAAAAAEARGLMAASSRILGALDVVARDVIPRGGSAAGTAPPAVGGSRVAKPSVARRGIVPTWMRIAAGFVLVAGVAYLGRGRGELGSPPSVASDVASEAIGASMSAAVSEATSPVASGAVTDAAAPARTAASPIAPPISQPVVAPTVEQERKLIAAAKQNEADPSRREALSPVAAMLAPQERTAPAAAPAPASAPTAPASVATTRGVAGGVASPTVMRAVTEPQAAAGAAAGITAGAATVTADRELRAKSMQRAVTAPRSAESERAVDSPNALSALMADRAENAAALANVTGCWRAQTAARVDSIQTSMRVVRVAGDTLVLALTPAGAEARVLRAPADALTGTARDVSGRSAAFRAERTACTP